MNLLDKFTDIKMDNSKRLPTEDLKYCKMQEELFNNAYNAYLISYNNISKAYEKQKN